MATVRGCRLNYVNLVIFGVFLVVVNVESSSAQLNNTQQYRYVCPKNFQNVGRKCYHFSEGTATWFQAFFSCRDIESSNLTVFNDRDDQRHRLEHYLFRNYSKKRDHKLNSFWVGGFKDWKQKKWIYTDGSLIQFPKFNDTNKDWTCLIIDANKKRWRAENCMERRPFICESKEMASVQLTVLDKKVKRRITIDECISNAELLTKKQRKKCWNLLEGNESENQNWNLDNEPAAIIQQAKPAYPTQPTVIRAISHICPQNWMSLGNQCYLFSKEEVTWSEAHFNCGQINAKLAVIRSKVQDQKLRIFLNGFTEKRDRWIGGRYNSKTGEWIWALSGRPLKYRGFFKEPSLNSTENLAWQSIVMDPQHGYKWSHRDELEKHFYICQVKGWAVKRLNSPRRPSATIEIIPDRRYQMRNLQHNNRLRNRTSRRANRNKRT